MGWYIGFNIFWTLILLNQIGDFNLLIQKLYLMRLIESECCGRFAIYGHLELVLFLTVIVKIPCSYCKTAMGQPILSIVGRV